jgi:translocation and assembly module TamA
VRLLSEFLDLDELPDVPAQAAFERRMQVEVASLLATEGYFSPIVGCVRDAEQLLLEVDPGPRSHIGSVQLEIVGDLDPARRER